MPSSWSASLRFELPASGELINTWGDHLDVVLQHADYAIAGYLTKALTASPYTLTTANLADDEARAAMLKFTGTGAFTVTIPSVSKAYLVWNACTGVVTISTGAGATVAIDPGDIVAVFCDGSAVKTPGYGGLSLKDYITAFTATAGAVPSPLGNANKFLFSDGTNVLWQTVGATTAQILAATSLTAAITPGGNKAALVPYALTDGATVTPNGLLGLDFTWPIGGNRTLGAITNTYPGARGTITCTQDATGNRILAVHSSWKRRGGLGVLSTTALAVDEIPYEVKAVDGSGTATRTLYDVIRDPS